MYFKCMREGQPRDRFTPAVQRACATTRFLTEFSRNFGTPAVSQRYEFSRKIRFYRFLILSMKVSQKHFGDGLTVGFCVISSLRTKQNFHGINGILTEFTRVGMDVEVGHKKIPEFSIGHIPY